MDNIFDGIQRPLQAIKEASNGSIYIPKGIRTEALDKTKLWAFEPSANVKVIFDYYTIVWALHNVEVTVAADLIVFELFK